MIFGPFERLLAGRYLRARRTEGFVSVIAFFSLAGMTLGVGTLIVVMSVMGGFRTEFVIFFLRQKTAYEIGYRDWRSDECASDLDIASGLCPNTP